ncbi:MAG: nucleotide exchange factor GrpE [Candidatus Woesearchaeota archaeon]
MSKKEHEQQAEKKHEAKGEGENGQFKELQQQLKEANESLMRLKAEFANYQKRTESEKKETYRRAVADVLKSLVNVFDDFELALSHNQDGKDFRKGMELIYAKLYQMAEDHGLERINTLGASFDPNKHEVMLAEESDKPSQEVIEELQPGYMVDGKVIRNAKVKVAK